MPDESTTPELTAAESACVDFYRSAQESTEDGTIYIRALADRIAETEHREAAAILADIADQWDVGVWDGEHDEVWQSALWADAGRLLGEAGELRCADLSEWWGIDAYEGEPDPIEMLDRQRRIWGENELRSYYLLVAGKTDNDMRFTQIQVMVIDDQVESLSEVEVANLDPSQLPKTIDAYYDMVDRLQARVDQFDLVHAYPRRAWTSDGTEYYVRLDPSGYPDPLEYFEEISTSNADND